jgi:hypothetical protein
MYDNTLFWAFGTPDDMVKLYSSSYTLWEGKTDDNKGTGEHMSDFVANDGCKDVPQDTWNDRASVVTVCNFDCITLYQWDNCRGETSRLQAPGPECHDFYLTFFDKRTSAVGGCYKKNGGSVLIPFPA